MKPTSWFLAAAGSFMLTVPMAAQATQKTVEFDGKQAAVVQQSGETFVLQTIGPTANYGNGTNTFNLQWYVAQDSSLGLVFKEPSGLKVSSQGRYDADIDVRALKRIHAFEVTAITFNVWDQHAGTYQMTRRRAFNVGDEDGFDPRWYDVREESNRHRASIVYVSRVRLADGTIIEADPAPIHDVAKSIDPDFSTETQQQDLEEMLKLWRQFLREMSGTLPTTM